jgi:hypothetical protein
VKAHWAAVSQEVASAFRAVSAVLDGSDFYLAGGTGLALRLGHRVSVDLDLFSPTLTDVGTLRGEMRRCQPPFVVQSTDRRTLYGVVGDVVVAFFGYDYPLLRPPESLGDRLLPVASIEDIAAMKLAAIASRGSRKDFLDVWFMVKAGLGLRRAFALFEEKLGPVDAGHVVRSLTFFDDADQEVEPRLLRPVPWEEVKADFRSWVEDLITGS